MNIYSVCTEEDWEEANALLNELAEYSEPGLKQLESDYLGDQAGVVAK